MPVYRLKGGHIGKSRFIRTQPANDSKTHGCTRARFYGLTADISNKRSYTGVSGFQSTHPGNHGKNQVQTRAVHRPQRNYLGLNDVENGLDVRRKSNFAGSRTESGKHNTERLIVELNLEKITAPGKNFG